MIGQVTTFIENLVDEAGGGSYFFTHESNEAMNLLANRFERDGKTFAGVCQMERVRSGTFQVIQYRKCLVYQIYLYFFKYTEMDAPVSGDPTQHYTDLTDPALRGKRWAELHNEIVDSVMESINKSSLLVGTVSFTYPASRFDSVETGISVAFQYAFPIC